MTERAGDIANEGRTLRQSVFLRQFLHMGLLFESVLLSARWSSHLSLLWVYNVVELAPRPRYVAVRPAAEPTPRSSGAGDNRAVIHAWAGVSSEGGGWMFRVPDIQFPLHTAARRQTAAKRRRGLRVLNR